MGYSPTSYFPPSTSWEKPGFRDWISSRSPRYRPRGVSLPILQRGRSSTPWPGSPQEKRKGRSFPQAEIIKGACMDFSLSKEQIEFKEAIVTFARRELNHGIREREKEGQFSHSGWAKCAEFGIHSHIWTCENPIWKVGTEQQKKSYLPDLCRGKRIGGHAMTEPDSGSDAFHMKTRGGK